MDPFTIYAHNLIKRAVTGGPVHHAEIANAPKLIDKAYGNGDGHLDMDDVGEIVSNAGEEIAKTVGTIIDIFTSLF